MNKVIFAALAFFPVLACANSGPYVQAQAGMNFVDTNRDPNASIGAVAVASNSVFGFAGGLGVGYLWGNNAINYGLEINGISYPDSISGTYYYLTSTFYSPHYYKTKGYNLSLLAILKYTSGCTSGFVAFVKAGEAYVHQESSVIGDDIALSETNSKLVPEVDAGIGYQFNPNWEMDFTTNYVISMNSNVANNVNILLGLTYHFA